MSRYEFQLQFRAPSERLRYLATRLRKGDERLWVIVALEAWADELEQAEADHDDSQAGI